MTFLKGHRKITFKDGLYHILVQVIKNVGTIPATNIVTYDIKKKFTAQAINQSFQKIPSVFLSQINQIILSTFFKQQTDAKERRILLIDGTQISLSTADLKERPFPLTNSESYKKALVTFIYDLKQKVPICYDLATHGNERQSFLDLKKYLRRDDILIFDRGYYSHKILKELIDAGYFVIFRVSKTIKKAFEKDNNTNDQECEHPFKRRMITYIVKETDYTLITNLPSTFETIDLSNLYHNRWQIEEFYKFLKLSLGGDFYNLKLL